MARGAQKTIEIGALLALAACGRIEEASVEARTPPAAAEGLERARAEALAGELERAEARAQAGEEELTRLGARAGALEAELARLEGQRVEERARVAELEGGATQRRLASEVAHLRRELEASEEKRIAREREWLAYTTAVTSLEIESLPDDLVFVPEGAVETEADAGPSAEELALVQREGELHRSLRTLLAVEEVRGLDLLEAGTLGDGWIGPVVFRLLDADGRLGGSLWAERLRLEGSRAARTLTLVLEDGYETRGGRRVDFALRGPTGRSERRIVLPRVDPAQWVDALPELFGGARLDEPVDDGRWNHSLVRGSLNELLRRDAAGGWYRLKSFGGVMAGVFRGVHLEHLDREGRVERHLFADRMQVERRERGVLLLLEDGAQMRGQEKAVFLDGRFPVYLPRARIDDWERAGIPGLVEPPSDDP